LLALAETGQGVAIIPSVLRTDRYRLKIARVTVSSSSGTSGVLCRTMPRTSAWHSPSICARYCRSHGRHRGQPQGVERPNCCQGSWLCENSRARHAIGAGIIAGISGYPAVRTVISPVQG
jgi:hypothetical protein